MGYHLLRFFWRLASLMPLWFMYGVVDVLFVPFYYVVRYRRKVVRRNLTGSFPEMSLPQIRRIERRFYRYMLDTIAETCKMATISERAMRRRMRFTNVEQVAHVLEQGRSVALYLGHYGNWEWISSMPLALPEDVIAGQVYKRLDSKAVNGLLLKNRERMGARCIEARSTARTIHEWMQQGRVCIVGFIADQAPRRREAWQRVPFLHHDARTAFGTEKLTRHFGLEAWFLDVQRVRRGHYEATFVQISEAPAGLPELELTARFYQYMERTIRRQPELYLWSHNRFKEPRNKIVK